MNLIREMKPRHFMAVGAAVFVATISYAVMERDIGVAIGFVAGAFSVAAFLLMELSNA